MLLRLFHSPTAVCAAKVRIALAEKELQWDGILLDLSAGDQFKPDYLRLNKKGVVPTLVHGANVIVESTVINEYLDEAFDTLPLRPPDPHGRAKVRLWTKREDAFHAAVNTLTTVMVFRPELLEKTESEREARISAIPEPQRRAKWNDILLLGMQSRHVREAMSAFRAHIADMQQSLESSSWLGGDRFSLADVGLISFFHRLEALQLGFMWLDLYPQVEAWFTRCKSRTSFDEAVLQYTSIESADRYARYGTLMHLSARHAFEAASGPRRQEI